MEELLVTTKSAVLVYFFLIYCVVLFWVLRRKNRDRLESHRYIPFREDNDTNKQSYRRCRDA